MTSHLTPLYPRWSPQDQASPPANISLWAGLCQNGTFPCTDNNIPYTFLYSVYGLCVFFLAPMIIFPFLVLIYWKLAGKWVWRIHWFRREKRDGEKRRSAWGLRVKRKSLRKSTRPLPPLTANATGSATPTGQGTSMGSTTLLDQPQARRDPRTPAAGQHPNRKSNYSLIDSSARGRASTYGLAGVSPYGIVNHDGGSRTSLLGPRPMMSPSQECFQPAMPSPVNAQSSYGPLSPTSPSMPASFKPGQIIRPEQFNAGPSPRIGVQGNYRGHSPNHALPTTPTRNDGNLAVPSGYPATSSSPTDDANSFCYDIEASRPENAALLGFLPMSPLTPGREGGNSTTASGHSSTSSTDHQPAQTHRDSNHSTFSDQSGTRALLADPIARRMDLPNFADIIHESPVQQQRGDASFGTAADTTASDNSMDPLLGGGASPGLHSNQRGRYQDGRRSGVVMAGNVGMLSPVDLSEGPMTAREEYFQSSPAQTPGPRHFGSPVGPPTPSKQGEGKSSTAAVAQSSTAATSSTLLSVPSYALPSRNQTNTTIKTDLQSSSVPTNTSSPIDPTTAKHKKLLLSNLCDDLDFMNHSHWASDWGWTWTREAGNPLRSKCKGLLISSTHRGQIRKGGVKRLKARSSGGAGVYRTVDPMGAPNSGRSVDSISSPQATDTTRRRSRFAFTSRNTSMAGVDRPTSSSPLWEPMPAPTLGHWKFEGGNTSTTFAALAAGDSQEQGKRSRSNGVLNPEQARKRRIEEWFGMGAAGPYFR